MGYLFLVALADRNRIKQLYETLHGNGRGLEFFISAIQGMNLEQEQLFLEKLAVASTEVQTDIALACLYEGLNEAETTLLQKVTAYQVPVTIEGIIKIAEPCESTEQIMDRLLAVSLLERHYDHRWQCDEYQIPATVREWLAAQKLFPAHEDLLKIAAEFQFYLFKFDRQSLEQVIRAYKAYRLANENNQADQLVLDFIIGPLNRQGLFRTLLDVWLPQVCKSSDDKVKAEALGQVGKQYFHIGGYATALEYLKQSLAI